MQKNLKFIYALAILFAGSLIISCSPEDGETGPVGPQGERGTDGTNGIDGTDGADGADGADGEPGTANVIYSEWTTTELSSEIAGSTQSFTIDAPDIDLAMQNTGTILVYARRIDPVLGAIVYPLPIVFGGGRQQIYSYRSQVGEIRISVTANEEGEAVGDGTFLSQYRYVLIPGGTPANTDSSGGGSLTGKTNDFSKMTYSEIAERFNFEE